MTAVFSAKLRMKGEHREDMLLIKYESYQKKSNALDIYYSVI